MKSSQEVKKKLKNIIFIIILIYAFIGAKSTFFDNEKKPGQVANNKSNDELNNRVASLQRGHTAKGKQNNPEKVNNHTISASDGGINIFGTGNSTIKIGSITITVTKEEYEKRLSKRVMEVTKALVTAQANEKFLLEREKEKLEKALGNIESSYKQYIAQLTAQIARLEKHRKYFPPKILEQAKQALAQGDDTYAVKLFKQVDELSKNPIMAAAEADYQQGLFAFKKFDYPLAQIHFHRASELQPNNPDYLIYAGMASAEMEEYDKAVKYTQTALMILEKNLGKNHQDVTRVSHRLRKYRKMAPAQKRNMSP